MQEETALTSLPFSVEIRRDALRLALELDLERIVPSDQALEAAVSAVLKPKVGEATYWALTHPRPQADFHWREGFILDL